MSPTSERAAILRALLELTGPADAGGHRVAVVSVNDSLGLTPYLIYPKAGLGEHRYIPRYSEASARVLTDILAKRAKQATAAAA